MKTKKELLKDLFITLEELNYLIVNKIENNILNYLTIKLEILYDILGEDVPEEY